MGDPERYRKPEEIHKWQENDPIGIYRRYLLKNEMASEAELDEYGDLAETEVTEAVDSPKPAPNRRPKSCSRIFTWKNRGGGHGKNYDA